MKKKLVLSLLVIVALFTFTACGSKENGKDNKVDNNVSKDVTEKKESKEELVYEDTNHGYKTTFKYNKDDFVITKSGISSNTNLNEVYLESKNLDINIVFTFYIFFVRKNKKLKTKLIILRTILLIKILTL